MKKIRVGILGSTGMVGQRFVQLLQNHPWFELVCVAASSQSAGKTYEQAVKGRWKISNSIPDYVKKLIVLEVQEIEKIAGRPSSLNAPISLDGTAELVDLLADDEAHGPELQMEELLKNSRIQEFLDQLDERERKILVLRFGLGKDDPKTLEEVAQDFGITRERVRQIEGIAIKKIRERVAQGKEKLQDYVNP